MLSFSTVASKIRIAIDTDLDPYINVNLNNGPVLYSRNVEESYTTLTQPTRTLTKTKLRATFLLTQ